MFAVRPALGSILPPAPSYHRILYLAKILQDDDTLLRARMVPSFLLSPLFPLSGFTRGPGCRSSAFWSYEAKMMTTTLMSWILGIIRTRLGIDRRLGYKSAVQYIIERFE